MKDYSDIENDTLDAYDATSAIVKGQEHEAQHQAQQVHKLGAEEERNQSAKSGILRAASGNGAKRFKTRQESRVTTRAGNRKSAKAVIKQVASQELQREKEKMQEWKENVMQDVARELQLIRQVQEEAMEAQRLSFQVELERVGKVWEIKSKLLENEIRLLKTRDSAQLKTQKKL